LSAPRSSPAKSAFLRLSAKPRIEVIAIGAGQPATGEPAINGRR
jgi:hypothetical protein